LNDPSFEESNRHLNNLLETDPNAINKTPFENLTKMEAEEIQIKQEENLKKHKERCKRSEFFVRMKTKVPEEDEHSEEDNHLENEKDDHEYDKSNFYQLKISNKVRAVDRKLDQLYKHVDHERIELFANSIDKFYSLPYVDDM
jgi:hypothetical protein